ncbi:MAG: low temperature requirement protein A [Nitratireductor sp.]|nr:low temperature requirement protein A [Nitratireductor sp.]
MTRSSPIAAFRRPMPPRDPHEAQRVATPLELFFDLVSVIAIAAAAAGLHHAIAENHAAQGVITFLIAFFAVWWAWMNYTWFASAYDNDDAVFRLLTFVIMAGSLTMASGIGNDFDFRMGVAGYVIMRIAMVAFWLRAARHDGKRRAAALTYAGGIAAVQAYWILFLLLQPLSTLPLVALFTLGVVLELAVPVLAERKINTPWHRHHIIERYGLLNIIVLGETLLSGALALRQVSDGAPQIGFVHITLSALVIVFSMWWLYFVREEHLDRSDLGRAIPWGYGHFVIYASGAAVGAGFAVLVDIVAGKAHVPLLAGDYAVAVPVALYMLGLWFVRDRFCFAASRACFVLPVFAALVLIAPLLLALEGVALVTALSVVARHHMARQGQVGSQARGESAAE